MQDLAIIFSSESINRNRQQVIYILKNILAHYNIEAIFTGTKSKYIK
jgi:hypothetical protein